MSLLSVGSTDGGFCQDHVSSFQILETPTTGVILDSLKFYFAIFEVQKPRRKMETAELGAGRAGSMVLMLKN